MVFHGRFKGKTLWPPQNTDVCVSPPNAGLCGTNTRTNTHHHAHQRADNRVYFAARGAEGLRNMAALSQKQKLRVQSSRRNSAVGMEL